MNLLFWALTKSFKESFKKYKLILVGKILERREIFSYLSALVVCHYSTALLKLNATKIKKLAKLKDAYCQVRLGRKSFCQKYLYWYFYDPPQPTNQFSCWIEPFKENIFLSTTSLPPDQCNVMECNATEVSERRTTNYWLTDRVNFKRWLRI